MLLYFLKRNRAGDMTLMSSRVPGNLQLLHHASQDRSCWMHSLAAVIHHIPSTRCGAVIYNSMRSSVRLPKFRNSFNYKDTIFDICFIREVCNAESRKQKSHLKAIFNREVNKNRRVRAQVTEKKKIKKTRSPIFCSQTSLPTPKSQ